MKIALGPILYASDCTAATWKFRIQVFTAADWLTKPPADAIAVQGTDVTVVGPELIADLTDYGLGKAWCWRVEVTRGASEQRIRYVVREDAGEQEVRDVAIPSRETLPRIGLFSCSGFSAAKLASNYAKKKPYELWERMFKLHELAKVTPKKDNPSGFHLLLGGGDQLYCDEIELKLGTQKWKVLEIATQQPKVNPTTLEKEATRGYFEHYLARFSEPAIAKMMARVPLMMTWDDHEIFDGYGSYPQEVQIHATVQTLFRCARKPFVAFELGGDPAATSLPDVHPPEAAATVGGEGHLLQWFSFEADGADLDIVLLDLRSGREATQVLSDTQWSALEDVLGRIEKRKSDKVRHVLIASSIPVVHARHDTLKKFIDALPEKPEILDDLLDQWEHTAHRKEQLKLIDRLFRMQAKGCRVTIVSGDVHSGVALLIHSNRAEHKRGGLPLPILQITSSGIVHPPPPIAGTVLEPFVSAKKALLDYDMTTDFAFNRNEVKNTFEQNFTSIHFTKKADNDFSFLGEAYIHRKIHGPLGPIQFRS